MKPTLAFAFSALLLMSSCSLLFDRDRPVPEPELPPITNEGANAFGCRIDGEVYIPRSSNFSRPSITKSYGPTADRFFVMTNNFKNQGSVDQSLSIVIDHPVVGDTLWLGTEDVTYPPFQYERYGFFDDLAKLEYFSSWSEDSLTYSGYVYLTGFHYEFDGQTRFIAGTFAFTARNEDSTQFIEVTDGRFDIKFNN
ncbi:MAG: hypothetical protein NWR72_06455 [Bacteroidia bacterium]|nr:hypothetical protein [Bacteroidia bacterium]